MLHLSLFAFFLMSLIGSLKRNSPTKEITRKDAEKAVSKWLTGARDRGGNPAMRACGGEQNLLVTKYARYK